MQTANKKVVNGWAMYDWANSVYNLVITSTIFPAYFEFIAKDYVDADQQTHVYFLGRDFINTSLYNYALAIAFLIVAIASPLLSSIADYRGNKKVFMNFFLTLGSISCSLLFFFNTGQLLLGVVCMILACIGYWCSLVFYNSFLPEIAAPQDSDRISAKGFAMGYIGSVILQAICFVFVFKPELVGGNETNNLQFRLCFLIVGLWWWGFGQFSLSRLPKGRPLYAADNGAAEAGTLVAGHPNKANSRSLLANGYKELGKVWRQLLHLPVLKRYLVGFFFYNMGVQTIMLAATLYGKSELQIPTDDLVISILIIQLIAVPGAFAISKLSAVIGNFRALMVCVLLWIAICIIGYFLPVGGKYEFYGLAAIVGFVMGGIQSLSRSTYSKLMPETKDTTSFFSFYDVTEKIAIVIGLFSFGFITELTGSQRSSVLAVMLFFIMGLIGLGIASAKQRAIEKA